jgi:hypothetical protein
MPPKPNHLQQSAHHHVINPPFLTPNDNNHKLSRTRNLDCQKTKRILTSEFKEEKKQR